MRKDYDFSAAKTGAVKTAVGKTRLTIMLDNDVIAAFRAHAELTGKGYQTLINDALRRFLAPGNAPVTEASLQRVVDQTLKKFARQIAKTG